MRRFEIITNRSLAKQNADILLNQQDLLNNQETLCSNQHKLAEQGKVNAAGISALINGGVTIGLLSTATALIVSVRRQKRMEREIDALSKKVGGIVNDTKGIKAVADDINAGIKRMEESGE